ncbi:EH signature domain-containing protein [Cupriavidus campinensis]|uniref:EH signature domain-containing protein n=1 Tax=Cupriavidus campinensis TaxID=151783 RepID=UPI0024C44361|nr:EH signature domain-containing protein [Cupriavidus campinensis]
MRDAATSTIGNPWLRRTHWDAYVRVGDKADDQAREMVFFWLKERLVADFFELLSVDGINDKRRVAYWLRFVPFVEDMWFALGSSASSRRGGNLASSARGQRGAC